MFKMSLIKYILSLIYTSWLGVNIMKIKTKLLMTFKTSDDKKVSITVDNPREDLTETEIKEAMNTIIEKDIFSPNGGSLVSAVSAKVVQTDTTDYDLVL